MGAFLLPLPQGDLSRRDAEPSLVSKETYECQKRPNSAQGDLSRRDAEPIYTKFSYRLCHVVTGERASARESRHEGSAVNAADTHSESSGIAHSSLQKRHKARIARVRRQAVFDNLAPLAEDSADVLVPPHQQIPA